MSRPVLLLVALTACAPARRADVAPAPPKQVVAKPEAPASARVEDAFLDLE